MKKYIYTVIIILLLIAAAAVFNIFRDKDKNYYTNSLLVKQLEVYSDKTNC